MRILLLKTQSILTIKEEKMKIFLIVLAVAIIAIMLLAGIYNRLVALLNEAKNSFAQIDVQLKRRYERLSKGGKC